MTLGLDARFVLGLLAGAGATAAVAVAASLVWPMPAGPPTIAADGGGAVRVVEKGRDYRVLQRCRGACDEVGP